METAVRSYSLWILPPEHLADDMKRCMATIRSALGGPCIIPHLTVAGGIWTTAEAFFPAVESALDEYTPEPAQTLAVEVGERFFESIYLKASAPAGLCRLRSKIYQNLATEEPDFVPHLSLHYGAETYERKLSVLRSASLGPASIVTSRMAIATNDEQNLSWEIVVELECGQHSSR